MCPLRTRGQESVCCPGMMQVRENATSCGDNDEDDSSDEEEDDNDEDDNNIDVKDVNANVYNSMTHKNMQN